ncbi:MAG: DUF1127 domain-containing protein [Paracoccaceae bacterium]|nr:DUF1127 domain-containing protein [Paracoccaceae bacterium]
MAARTIARIFPSLPARRRRNALSRLVDWMALYRQRHRLSELPDHLLDDIGVSREAAEAEADRPVWDAPSHWLR